MNIGFTIGKFAPLHKGHQELIERGIAENDEFYILINNTDVTKIPLETRAKWIKEMYPQVHIILGKEPPKRYGMDKESIKIQTDYLKKMFKGINVTRFYSGEEYGKYVGQELNVESIIVKKETPISATQIREDIEKNKKYLESNIYQEIKDLKEKEYCK